MSRIEKTPMMTVHLTGKYRAGLICIAADGDDGFHRLRQKVIHVLGLMRGNIHADLCHHLNGERMDIARRFRPGALNIERVTRRRTQEAFRKMAAA